MIDLGEARVAYRDTGTGDPLLLVHGYPLSSQTWRKVVPPDGMGLCGASVPRIDGVRVTRDARAPTCTLNALRA